MRQALARWIKAAAPAFGLLMVLPGIGAAASFDCSKAGTRTEKMICADSELSGLDERLSEVFQKAVKQSASQENRLQQKRWMSEERDRCRDSACISATYKRRIAQLESAVARTDEVKRIIIDTPKSGWRNSCGERVLYTQKVSYPASSVGTQEEQSSSAVIGGRVTTVNPNDTAPFKLIVNGIPMPLRVENGAFSRPYSFSAGSNNVEIRSPDGSSTARVQFYEAYAEKIKPKIRVILSWNTNSTDLDLHVITPDGKHCFYGNRVLENGGALDVDVTTGYGPEIFATPVGLEGTYLVFVNYYGGPKEAGEEDLTVATISVVLNENTADEKAQTFTVPIRDPGELYLVDQFVYP